MNTDSKIYKNIGQILFNIAPKDAVIVLLRTQLSPENDVCDFKYHYINKLNEKNLFMPESGYIDYNLFEEIAMLRTFYIENNLNNGQQIWNTAHMSLDIATGKFDIEFEFDEVFEHEGEEFEE